MTSPTPRADGHADDASAPASARPLTKLPADLARGFLIGITELVPGVSGATIALIVGVYTDLIRSAGHVIGAGKNIVSRQGWASTVDELKKVDWRLIIPVLVGMVAAVFLLAGPIHHLVESYPMSALGLFFGIVVVGIAAPLRMVRWSIPPGVDHVILFGVGFVAAFLLTGLAADGDQDSPSMIVIFLAAAVAICALVVPGVSGSFLLLAMGLYAPTLQAVDELNFAYIGVFAAGAAVGLASIVQVLLTALEKLPRHTVVLMAGLMAGSLRSLWPWQEESAPFSTGDIVSPILFMVVGAVFVTFMMYLDHRTAQKQI